MLRGAGIAGARVVQSGRKSNPITRYLRYLQISKGSYNGSYNGSYGIYDGKTACKHVRTPTPAFKCSHGDARTETSVRR